MNERKKGSTTKRMSGDPQPPPTWDVFLEMLEELSRTNDVLHEALHPYFLQVGEQTEKKALGQPIPAELWNVIEIELLEKVAACEHICLAHLTTGCPSNR